jgi:hypothetical protein
MRSQDRQYIKNSTASEWSWRTVSVLLLCVGGYLLLRQGGSIEEKATSLTWGSLATMAGFIWFILNEMMNRGVMEPRGAASIRAYLKKASKFVEEGDREQAKDRLYWIREFHRFYNLELPSSMEERIRSLELAVQS